MIGWCNVLTNGQPSPHETEEPGAEALVVVDEVELGPATAQALVDAAAERVRLGVSRRAHDRELLQVGDRAELVGPRDPERVVAPVEVEAGDLLERDGRVGDRPRLAGEHRDLVPELGQLPRDVAAVDALPPAVRVAAVDEEGDAQGIAGRAAGRGGK